jgi:hypothetical protein
MRERQAKSSDVSSETVNKTVKPLTIKQVAQRLGRTEWWTRAHFKKVAGALVMPGSGRRGKRRYETVTVPIEVLEREIYSFRVSK